MHRIKLFQRLLFVCLLPPLAWFCYVTRPDQPRLFLTRLNQLSINVEPRILAWNWKDTEEEKWCRSPVHDVAPGVPIPHVVHYVLLSDAGEVAQLSYEAFISIKATLLRLRPDKVKIHTTGIDPSNPWWELLRHHVTVVHYDRSELHAPHGLVMDELRLAHQADLLRIAVLQQEGGIYFDTDVFPLKPFTDLLHNPRDVVMGHEGGNRYGLCNAIILARPNSAFLEHWIDSYSTFDPSVWNYHSVRMPKLLQVQYPQLICPLSPTVFFWPTWAAIHHHYMEDPIDEQEARELERNMTMYDGAMYENQLAIHMKVPIDHDSVWTRVTRFNLLIRDVLDAPFP